MNTILIVEDDQEINNLVKEYFVFKGYSVYQAFSGTEALLVMKNHFFSAVILDLMLPGKNGEQIIQEIKSQQDIPIVIISAKEKQAATMETLQLGADDFISKPFDIDELFLRVTKNISIYHRIHDGDSVNQTLSYGNITLLEAERIVYVDEQLLNLTAKEFDILALLMKHPNHVFTKDKILEQVWYDDFGIDTNTVAVHVSNLRKKIKMGASIKTIWGIGFKLEGPL